MFSMEKIKERGIDSRVKRIETQKAGREFHEPFPLVQATYTMRKLGDCEVMQLFHCENRE